MSGKLLLPHYGSPAARLADLVIHVAGLVMAVIGGAIMLVLSIGNTPGRIAAVAVYAAGFVLMLTFSAAYNFSSERRRPFMRRLDHAGIFLMIAGSYTPFTTYVLHGAWAWGMTTAVWTIAIAGATAKLCLPDLRESISIAIYLMLGWIVVIAAGPIIEGLAWPALLMLCIGGLIYTIGVIFHVKEHLTYSRPIWHGHVLAGALVQWLAILFGTVLPRM